MNSKQHLEILYSLIYLNEDFKKYGVQHKKNKFSFDLEKIDQTSLAVKENITGIIFIHYDEKTYEYNPKIFLIINDEIIYNEKFGFPKKLDLLSPIKDLLVNIFDIIGIKHYVKRIINDKNNLSYYCYFDFFKENSNFIKIRENIINNIQYYKNYVKF